MKKIAFFCVLITVLIGSAAGRAQDSRCWPELACKPPLVGTWNMDIAQTDFGSNPAPKSLTITVLKDTPQMFSWRVRGVDDKGKPFAYSWSGPLDGSMHPEMVGGKPSGFQQSAKREQDGTLVRHGETPDGSSFDARGFESPDGSTATDEISSKSKDGKETKTKNVFHRVGAANHKTA